MPKEMEFQGVLVTVQTSGRLIGALIPFNRSGKPHNTRVVFCFSENRIGQLSMMLQWSLTNLNERKKWWGRGGGSTLSVIMMPDWTRISKPRHIVIFIRRHTCFPYYDINFSPKLYITKRRTRWTKVSKNFPLPGDRVGEWVCNGPLLSIHRVYDNRSPCYVILNAHLLALLCAEHVSHSSCRASP